MTTATDSYTLAAETTVNASRTAVAHGGHDPASIATLFAKEKAELRKEIDSKNDQLDSIKLKMYHQENTIASLQTELKEAKKTSKRKSSKSESQGPESLIDTVYGKDREKSILSTKDREKSIVSTKDREKSITKERKSSATTTTNGLSKKKNIIKKKKGKKCTTDSPKLSEGTPAGDVSGSPADFDEFYEEIKDCSEKFPQMKLKTFVNCRKKFIQADQNGDGTVDGEEMSKILESSGLYFTDSQIKEIVVSLDVDNNVALDFLEVLQVVNALEENPNRRVDLPKSLKDNQSKVCSIM